MNCFSTKKAVVYLVVTSLVLGACNLVPAPPPPPQDVPASATPLPTRSFPYRPENRLPTPTPMISSETGAALDQFIRSRFPLFSGSVLVARKGEILLSSGYRYSNWELEVPNYSGTIFRISSITKPFTALAVLMLVERGQLSLDDHLCTFISNCPAEWEPITLHQLLTHTSGIPDYSGLPGALKFAAAPHSLDELFATFWDNPLEFDPGEGFSYSNSGYLLLGEVIEIVSQLTYEQFLAINVIQPLGMEDSGLDFDPRILKNRAAGYTINGSALENSAHVDASNLFSAAGLFSTVEDLYRWVEALYAGQLISAETLQVMISPQVTPPGADTDYGYGWYLARPSGNRVVAHGKLPGFRTFLARYPEDQVDIILLSNLDTIEIEDLAAGLEEILFPENEPNGLGEALPEP
jgi:CubicO group peptidase (beta-lactamase class C family)